MRVFVLTTGRSGSKTFAEACRHITNYTSAHESRTGRWGHDRLAYPDQHIEVDNRLSWHLGELDERYGDTATYVHLRRASEAVIASHLRRWDLRWRGGITRAFAHGILMHPGRYDEDERHGVTAYLVATVEANIRLFLKDKTRVVPVHMESAVTDFDAFWDAIGAAGDRAAARAEWAVRHNASPPEGEA